jgi:hypothetical protein
MVGRGNPVGHVSQVWDGGRKQRSACVIGPNTKPIILLRGI